MRKLNRASVDAPTRFVDPIRKSGNDQELINLHRQNNGKIPRNLLNSKKWRHNSVRDRLAEISHTHCAYCERHIHDTNNRGQVEHFRPIAKYWWLAYIWENLLYACERCNKKKLDHFPLNSPKAPDWGDLNQERPLLINPLDEDPQDFMTSEFSETGDPGKIIPKNTRSKRRVEKWDKCLGLNRFVLKLKRRFILGCLQLAIASHQEGKALGTQMLRDLINPDVSEYTGMVMVELME
ncbi:MAG: retron system putative HNH endonuclease [Candidatus Thorarchaeota archaeon]